MSGENETLAKTSKPKFSVFLLIEVHRAEALKEKDYVIVSCQTDIDLQRMVNMIKNLSMVRTDNKTIRNELSNQPELKRKLFMDDVLINEKSVKLFTGFPNFTCLMPSSNKSWYFRSFKFPSVNKRKPSRLLYDH